MTLSVMWLKYSSKSTISCHVKGVIRSVDQNSSHIPPSDNFLYVYMEEELVKQNTSYLNVMLGLKYTNITMFTEDPTT